MFDPPKKTMSYVAPATPIDVDTRYIFKLVHIQDNGVSRFADPAKNESFHDIEWHFNIANAETRQPILDIDGNPWKLVDYSNSKMGKNVQKGMVSKSRLWIEALLGHSIEDDEITPDLPDQLIGKYAVGFFEAKEKVAQTGEPYTKLQIMRLTPYKAGAKAEPKPEPKPVAVAAAATADSELPF